MPGGPENPEQNLTLLRICLVGWLLVSWLLFREAVQRPPAGAKIRKAYMTDLDLHLDDGVKLDKRRKEIILTRQGR